MGKFWPLFALLLGAWVFLVSYVAPARSHEWFTGQENPVTGARCCGGSDCLVLNDGDWRIVAGRVFARWPDGKTYSMPADQMLPSHDKAGRPAACVWHSELKCFFAPLTY